MTTAEFELTQLMMSDADLIANVEKQISDLCRTGAKTFRMSVPPRVDDTDMLLCELVKRFKSILTPLHPSSPDDDGAEAVLKAAKDNYKYNWGRSADDMANYLPNEVALTAMRRHAQNEVDRFKSSLTPPVPYNTVRVPSEETKLNASDKYGFRVPYDGTNNFYDKKVIKSFEGGWNECIDTVRRLNPNTKFETI